MFFKKKKIDISLLINDGNFSKASAEIESQLKKQNTVYISQQAWHKINLDSDFSEEEIKLDENLLPEEFFETIRIYYFLIDSDWPTDKKEKYLKISKHIILKISTFIRNNLFGEIRFDPNLRESLQDFIQFVKKQGLKNDQADLSAIKAQLSGSLLQLGWIEKKDFGIDMLQYAESYENVGLTDQSMNIYKAIINDFKSQSRELSSGLFPEIQHIDDPTDEELEIITKAKDALDRLSKN